MHTEAAIYSVVLHARPRGHFEDFACIVCMYVYQLLVTCCMNLTIYMCYLPAACATYMLHVLPTCCMCYLHTARATYMLHACATYLLHVLPTCMCYLPAACAIPTCCMCYLPAACATCMLHVLPTCRCYLHAACLPIQLQSNLSIVNCLKPLKRFID